MGNSLDPNLALNIEQLETGDTHIIMHKAAESSSIDLDVKVAKGIYTTVENHMLFAWVSVLDSKQTLMSKQAHMYALGINVCSKCHQHCHSPPVVGGTMNSSPTLKHHEEPDFYSVSSAHDVQDTWNAARSNLKQ